MLLVFDARFVSQSYQITAPAKILEPNISIASLQFTTAISDVERSVQLSIANSGDGAGSVQIYALCPGISTTEIGSVVPPNSSVDVSLVLRITNATFNGASNCTIRVWTSVLPLWSGIGKSAESSAVTFIFNGCWEQRAEPFIENNSTIVNSSINWLLSDSTTTGRGFASVIPTRVVNSGQAPANVTLSLICQANNATLDSVISATSAVLVPPGGNSVVDLAVTVAGVSSPSQFSSCQLNVTLPNSPCWSVQKKSDTVVFLLPLPYDICAVQQNSTEPLLLFPRSLWLSSAQIPAGALKIDVSAWQLRPSQSWFQSVSVSVRNLGTAPANVSATGACSGAILFELVPAAAVCLAGPSENCTLRFAAFLQFRSSLMYSLPFDSLGFVTNSTAPSAVVPCSVAVSVVASADPLVCWSSIGKSYSQPLLLSLPQAASPASSASPIASDTSAPTALAAVRSSSCSLAPNPVLSSKFALTDFGRERRRWSPARRSGLDRCSCLPAEPAKAGQGR